MIYATLGLLLAAVLALPVVTTVAVAGDCSEAVTQADMSECADQSYRAADKALNAEYGKAMAALDETAGTALRDAQRAWIAFRDLACKAEAAQYAGGSIAPMVFSDCLTRLTERRTEDLRLLSQTY